MEMIYQYLWKQRMMGLPLVTVDGQEVKIIATGIHNRDAGPDFLGARVRIGTQEWGGNVEIHVKASDWYRHGHDSDPAYDNVILHVVALDDARIARAEGSEIPQITITLPESFFRMYARLSGKIDRANCEPWLAQVPQLQRADWLSTLAIERIQMKADRILECVKSLNGDWNQATFVMLARALGFNLNGDPLDMLARSLPLNIIHRHSDNLLQIEALLFGQAGMLDTSLHIFDDYYQSLGREYFFLARKYGLRPMNPSVWKYARTRPQNFPHRRIAMLATALYGGFSLLADIRDRSDSMDDMRQLFQWLPGHYWETHSDFDTPGSGATRLSHGAIDLIMINFTAPVLYAYSAAHGDPDGAERAFGIWERLRPENNTYIRGWQRAGITPADAADSQALLHLSRDYCDAGRCLDCRFASTLLKAASGIPFNLPKNPRPAMAAI